jgi:hypothetical protein
MFEKDKSFGRPEVQACYADLVEKVADASDGVFLWAGLAIRSLLNAIGRYDPIDSLKEHLRGIPRNINQLYKKMFMSIDPVDRDRAFKLLLLVAGVPGCLVRLNALSVTWLLEDLEHDVDFPIKCETKPYTDEQLRRRQLAAKYQVDSLTKGLLEIVGGDEGRLFWQKHVQFFHRTVRDFVRQSSDLQEFAATVPSLTDVPTYLRVLLAELCFARTDDIRCNPTKYSMILLMCGDRLTGYELLDAYGRAMEHHNKEPLEGSPIFCGLTTGLRSFRGSIGKGALSFVHFLANLGTVNSNYVQRRVAADPGLLQPQGPMSLLLSAAVGWNSPTVAKALLDAGASPHDIVSTYTVSSQFTVWQLTCTAFVCQMMDPSSRSDSCAATARLYNTSS